MSNQERKLDTCGCCEGVKVLTPAETRNLPGLSALAYRVGTHAGFKMTMQSALSGQPRLRTLTTRADDDPAIALCDAWASVLDVLSFYQERIANEGYLRTATQRRSILEMARSIGYELRPGVAAGTYLAFSLETAKGSLPTAKIEVGTKARSVPSQDESAQVFETVEEIEAKSEWNELKPKRVETRLPAFGDTKIYLKGVTTGLRPGDPLLIVGEEREKAAENENWEFRQITTVEVDVENQRTCVQWHRPLGSRVPRVQPPSIGPKVFALRTRAALFGHNAMDWKALPVALRIGEWHPKTDAWIIGKYANRQDSWADTEFDPGTKTINLDAVYGQVVINSWIVLSSRAYRAELYRVEEIDEETTADYNITAKTARLRISGENIEKFSPRLATVFAQSEQLDIADAPLTTPIFGNRIDLDRKVEGLKTGQTLIITGRRLRSVKVAERTTVRRIGRRYVTEPQLALKFDRANGLRPTGLKSGDVLDVVEPPEGDRPDGTIKWYLKNDRGLSGFVEANADDFVLEQENKEDVAAGRLESANQKERLVSEVVTLNRTEVDGECTILVLATSLQNVYYRDSVTINGNVARATHGETQKQVLGSGDSSQAFQKFELKQKPLTYTSAPTSTGTKSTLEVRVNDLLWEEVPAFDRLAPGKRAYITRIADDGKVTVQFGDGINGARLPTGVENVVATYRVGTGPDGMLKAGQITTLMTRPLGVKEVNNPLASTGADNPEKLERARRNAPLTVLTFDRIVSLSDYEDFASAFAGIGKAQATIVSDGEQRLVHITLAGADGAPVEANSDLHKNLVEGIDAARHPNHRVKVDSYKRLTFDLKAKVLVDTSYIAEDVLASVRAALVEAFSFERRSFGQAVTASQVLAIMQKVKGVMALDLDHLYLTSQATHLHTRLPENTADWEISLNNPARLLTVNPQGITLTEMTI